MQGYRIVKAPFDGVITVRNVDVGALVSTGSTLLYRIAQIGTLRTYVNVPQASVNAVHVGQAATLTVSHLPGRTLPRHRGAHRERARSGHAARCSSKSTCRTRTARCFPAPTPTSI